MFRITAAAMLIAAVALSACGQSAQDKATSQVCKARTDIQKQVDYLQSLTLATVTKNGVKDSVTAIGNDVKKIADAQSQLNAERKHEVQSANEAFKTELTATLTNLGTSLSAQNAKAQVKSALQQLGQSYKQSLGAISCP